MNNMLNDVIFTSQNFSKLVKNVKEYKTKLYFTIKVSVIKIDNDFKYRNFDRVSESLKFRRYLYFRQVVRSSNCLFTKIFVRQNVRRQNVRSAKCSFGKMSFGKMSGHREVVATGCGNNSTYQNLLTKIPMNYQIHKKPVLNRFVKVHMT